MMTSRSFFACTVCSSINNQSKSKQESVFKSTKANEVNPMDPKAYSNCPVSIIRMRLVRTKPTVPKQSADDNK